MTCRHCNIEIWSTHDAEHPGLCCDCFDLSFGMPLTRLNAERVEAGRPPIEKPWPQRTVLPEAEADAEDAAARAATAANAEDE